MAQRPSEVLLRFFEKKKAERRGFSVRSLALRLNLSPSFTSQVLNGRRSVPLELAEQLCAALDLDKETRDDVFSKLFRERGLSQKVARLSGIPNDETPNERNEADWKLRPKQQFDVLVDWTGLAILDATLLVDYDGSPDFIASRLNLSLESVRETLDHLIKNGLLVLRDGVLKKTDFFLEFNSGKNQEEIRAFHKQHLENAKRILTDQVSDEDRERRLITGLTITASEKKVAWAKIALNSFMRHLATDLGSSEAEDVYHLAIQLFPLTNQRKKSVKK